MKKYFLLIFIIILCILTGCADPDEPSLSEDQPLVVEGWIEENESPIVIVTHAVDLTADTASFDDVLEKWGRVSIFDGDTRYLLTGHIDKDYTPGFVFTTAHLKGKVGHTYRLLIETEGDTVSATATMLPSPEISKLEATLVNPSDSLYSITAYFNNIEEDGYYKVFCRDYSQETRFFSSFLGTFVGKDYDTTNGFTVSRAVHSVYDSDDEFNHYFKSGSRVTIKLCSLETTLYNFWHTYDSSISLSQNIFFTFDNNCPSNIEGGLGYWAAYGMDRRTIRIH